MTSAVIYSMLDRLMRVTDLIFSRISLEKNSYLSKTLQKDTIQSPIPILPSIHSYKQDS